MPSSIGNHGYVRRSGARFLTHCYTIPTFYCVLLATSLAFLWVSLELTYVLDLTAPKCIQALPLLPGPLGSDG